MAVDDYVTFSEPRITAKHYIAKGPSGWDETFKRLAADAELTRFVAPLPVEEVAALFLTQRELSDNKEATDWYTIAGFLGRMYSMSPRAVPHVVVIAFWARVLIVKQEQGAN